MIDKYWWCYFLLFVKNTDGTSFKIQMEESEISDALKKKQHSNKLATVRGMNFGGKPYAYSIRHTRDRHLL